jgi:very-short-patch-repair endonuclease
MRGYQFLRQKPLDNYIADFYCQLLNLVIEIDGSSHSDAGAQEYDQQRDIKLQEMGLFTLRIDDRDVKQNMGEVLRAIEYYIDEYEARNPPPEK